MKNKSSLSPALPEAEPPLRLGFTVWTELQRRLAADVLSFRNALDAHLASHALVRSMNPMHMLIWSPTRDATLADQVALLAFMSGYGRAAQVEVGCLRTHVGIPELRGRETPLQVCPNHGHFHAVLLAHRYCGHGAEWVLEQLSANTSHQP